MTQSIKRTTQATAHLTSVQRDGLALTLLTTQFPGQMGFLKKPTAKEAEHHFFRAMERSVDLLDSMALRDSTKQNTITLEYVTDCDDEDDDDSYYDEVLVKINGTTCGFFSEVEDEMSNAFYLGHFLFFPLETKRHYRTLEQRIAPLLALLDTAQPWVFKAT